jgi:hypothetical protein
MLMRPVFFITLIYLSLANQSFASDYVKVADLPNQKISLYAKEDVRQEIYINFKLVSNNHTYNFPNWVSTTNPTYHPLIRPRDIDNDGKAELDYYFI